MNKFLFVIAIVFSGCSVPFAPTVNVSVGGEQITGCDCKCHENLPSPARK